MTAAWAALAFAQGGEEVGSRRAARPDRALSLRGTVGDSLRVTMRLSLVAGKPGAYAGTYFYEKAGAYVPKWLSLEGARGADGALTLTETDPEGKKTGRFLGRLSEAGPRRGFLGVWETPDGARKLPVSLAEAAPIPSGVRYSEGQVRDAAKKPIPFEIDIVWPRLSGGPGLDAFNRAAEQAARAEVARFRKSLKESEADAAGAVPEGGSWYLSSDAVVRSVTPRAVSAEIGVGTYQGGAHGSSWTRSVNIDRKTGARLALRDVFAPSVDAPALLSKLVKPVLLADLGKDGFFPEGADPKANNFRNWALAPEGLVLTFDVYQVAPYAAGPLEVVLPWPLLRPHLRPDGPAAPFLR